MLEQLPDDVPFRSPELSLLAFTLKARVHRTVEWGGFTGSIVHGVLGATLKQMVCVNPTGNCAGCFLLHTCPYGVLIERPVLTGAEEIRARSFEEVAGLHVAKSQPLSLSVLPFKTRRSEEGEYVRIRVVLAGSACAHAALVLLSLAQGLEKGIGKKIHAGERGRILVSAVIDDTSGTETTPGSIRYDEGVPAHAMCWSQLAGSTSEPTAIRFLTPVRIQAAGKITSSPSVSEVCGALFRRLAAIALFYCNTDLRFDYAAVLRGLDALGTTASVRRLGLDRYSSRQKQRMSQDGMMGEINISSLPKFLHPWFAVGQYTGIGKGTSMGMGRYELR